MRSPGLSIRSSILALGLVGALAAGAIAASGLWTQAHMNERAVEVFVAKDVVADILPPPMYLIEVRLVLSQRAEGTLSPDQARQRFDALEKDYLARVAHWTANPPYGLERQLLGRQHEVGLRFLAAARQQMIDAPVDTPADQLLERLKGLHAQYQAHRDGVDETVQAANAFASATAADFERSQASARVVAGGVLLGGLLMVLLGYRLVWGQLERPLRHCAGMARRIAAGDLAPHPDQQPARQDLIGELQQAMEAMRSQLAALVASVRGSAEGVAAASVQIARGNAELAQRNEQQADALQATSASVDELGAAVRSNAASAQSADQLACGASAVAAQGGELVGRVVEVISGVNDSSRRIADIIGVIDGIAFQTNILALNAAVEAARAGEQGRGFAVVAGEVRSLAQRSAEAAREIKGLIGASVERVAESTALVDQAGRTMTEIVGSILHVTDSVASREQSDGVARMSEAMGVMGQSTRQNSALVQEAAVAADGLREQAEHLLRSVAVFRLGDGQPAPRGTPTPAAAPGR